MATTLRVLLFILGTPIVLISLLHIALGPAAIPRAIAVNATMDSEDRFYATFFLAFGAAILWCLKDVRARAGQIRLLMAVFFLGGMARIVSMLAVGLPHPLFVALTATELGLPPLMVWLAAKVARGDGDAPGPVT